MEAKKALQEADGNMDKAIEELRKRGAAKAAKKADRETKEGRVHTYTHGTGKVGVIIEVLCETDFVARNEAFIELCNNLALHIVGMNPAYMTREEVPAEELEKEKDILREQLKNEGKPEEMLEKIMEGKMDKFYSEICLMEQKYMMNEDLTIEQFMQENVLSLGENMKIARFARYEI